MRITISTKIIAGYVLAIFMALGILVVGLMGINRINEGLSNIVNGSMPMISSVGDATNSMLMSDLEVMRFISLNNLDDTDSITNNFTSLREASTTQTAHITQISQGHPLLKDAASPISDKFNAFYESAQKVLDSHHQALEAKLAVLAQDEASTNLANDLFDLTFDLQDIPVIAEDEVLTETTVLLQNNIDLFLNIIKDAITEKTLAKTQDAENQILNEMENTKSRRLSTLVNGGLANNDTFITFRDGLQDKFIPSVVGENGVLNKLRTEIQLNLQTKSLKADMDVKSQDLLKTLTAFSATVNKISDEEIKASAEASVTNSTRLLIIFTAIAAIGLSTIAYFITQSIRTPLKHIVDNILEVSTGNFKQTFTVNSNDELGDLAQSMQQLVDTLRSMIEKINVNSSQLARTAENTARISNTSFNNINSQTEQTNRVAASVQEMSATVAEVAQSVSSTLEQVESTHSDVSNGEQLLQENINDIKELARNIEHGSQVIENLNENTNNIGSILDVIRGISEQTNLLALNAAIEAARAGELGRGFAVVADEVRTLASRTQDSTSEIQEMIGRLQQGAKEAVSTMSQSRTDAQQSAEKIAEAGRMLSDIANSVDVIKDMSTQIASATEEQSQTAREQTETVGIISDLANSTAQGAQESLDASQELSSMADTQTKLLSQFKV